MMQLQFEAQAQFTATHHQHTKGNIKSTILTEFVSPTGRVHCTT